MLLSMNWSVIIDPSARKILKNIPQDDARRIGFVLRELVVNPYAGDIEKMEGESDVWRRRVGSYRIFYEIHQNRRIVYVFKLKIRTSSTY